MILITGFGPFDRFSYNPAEKLAKALSEIFEFPHVILKVSYREAFRQLEEAYREFRPKAILSFGLAAGRPAVTPERVAINRRGPKKDVEGNIVYGKIEEDGPDGIMTEFPVDKIVKRLNDSGIPSYESFHAGTYLCNAVYYKALRLTDRKALFVHIPADYELVLSHGLHIPAMRFDDLLEAGKIILEEIEKLTT